MSVPRWSGRRVMAARAWVSANLLPGPCARCGRLIERSDKWVVGHIKSRATYPELTWVKENWQPEHRGCSDRSAQSAVIEKAMHTAVSSLAHIPGQPPPLPLSLPVPLFPLDSTSPILERPEIELPPASKPAPLEIRDELRWDGDRLVTWPWLAEFAQVPDDAAPPLAMTPPADDAVGSYGADAIAWAHDELGITLRWWQRLAITRQLEHRDDGTLCAREIVESAPRRSGKSVRVRTVALWRMAHAELFGEVQTVIHTGSDLAICREIQRGAWRWAERHGWKPVVANGKEAIETPAGDRWLVRAQDAVYGYDVCLGMIDEAWDVKPDTVTEGIEPATLERSSPQVHLTSTAHRRATSLMRSKITAALSANDPGVLLLLWGALPGSDPADPEVWRAASPHWSDDRRKLIAGKYAAALAGAADPELDDPDPVRGFEAQYLNIWALREARTVGEPVITDDDWRALAARTPTRPPDAVAVEAWFTAGVSLAAAWRLDGGRVVVSVTSHDSTPEAVIAAARLGCRRPVRVGASLHGHPAWKAHRLTAQAERMPAMAAVDALARMLRDGVLRHDGSAELSDQVLALRTTPSSNGPRLRSTGRSDAIKATVWATETARKAPIKGKIILPSSVR